MNADNLPPVGKPVLAKLKHIKGKIVFEDLFRDTDGEWRTVDDNSEISYEWDIVSWSERR